MSTNTKGQAAGSLFKKKSGYQEVKQKTPQSPTYSPNIDLKNLQTTQTGLIRQLKAFVIGISGGDCAGKKQLINFMFDKQEKKQGQYQYWSWKMLQTGQSVAVLHQNYFVKESSKKFSAVGTDWETFRKKAISLSLGNEIKLNIGSGQNLKKIKIAPAKVLCIQGSHIFCPQSSVNVIINIRLFIDSDSDVRLSRRVYKDTVENKNPLHATIQNYLTQIKPSYEKQIEPTKLSCDVIVPHFGNGYADHKMKDRSKADINIKNITYLLLARIRSAIKTFKDMQQKQQRQKQEKKKTTQIESSDASIKNLNKV